jgi:hypothetical protein
MLHLFRPVFSLLIIFSAVETVCRELLGKKKRVGGRRGFSETLGGEAIFLRSTENL